MGAHGVTPWWGPSTTRGGAGMRTPPKKQFLEIGSSPIAGLFRRFEIEGGCCIGSIHSRGPLRFPSRAFPRPPPRPRRRGPARQPATPLLPCGRASDGRRGERAGPRQGAGPVHPAWGFPRGAFSCLPRDDHRRRSRRADGREPAGRRLPDGLRELPPAVHRGERPRLRGLGLPLARRT